MVTSTESLPPPGWDREGLDGLLNAFPEGRLSEIVGPRSSGGVVLSRIGGQHPRPCGYCRTAARHTHRAYSSAG